MAEVITDRHLVQVLRPFVRSTRPLLAALRDADPFGLRERVRDPGADDVERTLKDKVLDRLAAAQLPGTHAWAEMDAHRRSRWWVGRVGRFLALIAAVPGVGGALADRLPVGDALGAAGQGLVLCAIAGEYGLRSESEQVRLLAAVLFKRDVDPVLLESPVLVEGSGPETVDAASAELTAQLTESHRRHGRATLRAVAGTVWRLGRVLWSLGDELDKRPRGRLLHRALGKLPVVGVLGNYLGERSAMHRAANAGLRWISAHPPAGGSQPSAGAG
jgi:hypothetical protein